GMSSMRRWPRASRQVRARRSGSSLPTTMRPSCDRTWARRADAGDAGWEAERRVMLDVLLGVGRWFGKQETDHCTRPGGFLAPPMGAGYTPLSGKMTMPVAFITHPSCSLHEMGPYHPECPERLAAVGDRMIAAGIDPYLRHYTAPEATREQIGRVH